MSPHLERVTVVVWRAPGDVFAQEAADSVLGQDCTLYGRPGRVTAARIVGGIDLEVTVETLASLAAKESS